MCHLVPLFFVIGIITMLGEEFLIGLFIVTVVVGFKLMFTTGDRWLTGILAFMVVVIVINTIT